MGNVFGVTGSAGLVAAVASSTVTFAQQTNAWVLVAFAVGPLLAFFIIEHIIEIFDQRRAAQRVRDFTDTHSAAETQAIYNLVRKNEKISGEAEYLVSRGVGRK